MAVSLPAAAVSGGLFAVKATAASGEAPAVWCEDKFAPPFERYLVGGANWTLAELFARVGRIARVPPPRLRLPPRVQTCAAALWESLARAAGRTPSFDGASVEMSQVFWYCDPSKAKAELDFVARDPLETIADTVRDLRARML